MSSLLEQIDVSEIMSVKIYPISPERSVRDAHRMMKSKHVSGLPVLEDEKLVGIITGKDVHNVQREMMDRTKVRDVMTEQVVTAYADSPVSNALERMARAGLWRIVVVSRTGGVIGIITRSDIDRTSKILENKGYNVSGQLKCSSCGASLKPTLSNMVKCKYCGNITVFNKSMSYTKHAKIVRRRGTAIVETPKGIILVAGRRDGPWILPGGGAKKGERRMDAVVRELKEETGLVAKDCKYVFSYREPDDGRRIRNLHKVFLIKAEGIPRPRSDARHLAYWNGGSNIQPSRTTRALLEIYLNSKASRVYGVEGSHQSHNYKV
ncbi:MAG: CBS domain-containing protein [Thaumarchaeota archaeon]|nr:CBS domain-containing protein [Nitrososphaerota archaeon]